MKKSIIIFLLLFLFEITIHVVSLLYCNSLLSLIKVIISLPLSFFDRTYPFYAEGSYYFGFFLTIINILIQTLIIIFIMKFISKK